MLEGGLVVEALNHDPLDLLTPTGLC